MPEVDVCKFLPRQMEIVWCSFPLAPVAPWAPIVPAAQGLPPDLNIFHSSSSKGSTKPPHFSLFCVTAKVLKGRKPKSLGNNLSVDHSQCCVMYSVALNSTIAAQFFIKSNRTCIFHCF